MTIGYRAILSSEYSEDKLDKIVNILRDWATKKKFFETLPVEGTTLVNPEGKTLIAKTIRDHERRVAGYRWILSEEWSPPSRPRNVQSSRIGVSHISIVFSQGQIWLWVDVEPPLLKYRDHNNLTRTEPQQSGTPAFVSAILSEVEMYDGLESPVPDVQTIASPSHVDHLLEVLSDSTRRGSAYVAAPPVGTQLDDWRGTIDDILGPIEGMGFGYVLTPSMMEYFNRQVSAKHAVLPGTMRTFLPGAELKDPREAFRHRLLHAPTIQDNSAYRLRRIIRNAQVARLDKINLPQALRDADYAFLRQQGLRTFEVLHEEAPSIERGEDSERVSDLMRRLSEAEDLVTEALDDNKVLREAEREAQSNLHDLRTEFDETYLDLTLLRESQEKLTREVEYFRRELSRSGSEGAAAAYSFSGDALEFAHPDTFEDLIERVTSVPGVRFFGNPDDAKELDEYSDLGISALMKAWDAIVTFSSYVTARKEGAFDQSLSHYVSNTQHGMPMRITKPQWSESETVRSNPRMIAQRTVHGLPKSIDPSGSKLLVAHIALATGRGGSPRLYFDDTYSAAGYVIVGHIGTHPLNTQTN